MADTSLCFGAIALSWGGVELRFFIPLGPCRLGRVDVMGRSPKFFIAVGWRATINDRRAWLAKNCWFWSIARGKLTDCKGGGTAVVEIWLWGAGLIDTTVCCGNVVAGCWGGNVCWGGGFSAGAVTGTGVGDWGTSLGWSCCWIVTCLLWGR